MFERFTDRARKVMALANQEAQRFNHEYIGPEHILLGLVKEGSGVGAKVLDESKVDLRKVRLEVEKLVKSGPEMVTMGKLPQTPAAKKVIEFAIEEARNLEHDYVGTEHVFLALLREQEHRSIAREVLIALGLELEQARKTVLVFLQPKSPTLYSFSGEGNPASSLFGGEARGPLTVRFTDQSMNVLSCAQQEARRFNHEYIGTEHLLLGLIKEGSGVAATFLGERGIDLRKGRVEVDKLVKSGPDVVTIEWLPFTPRAVRIVQYANEEAEKLRRNYVGTEHLLLAVLRESDGVGAQVLLNLEMKLSDAREQLLGLISDPAQEHPGVDVFAEMPEAPTVVHAEKVERYAILAKAVDGGMNFLTVKRNGEVALMIIPLSILDPEFHVEENILVITEAGGYRKPAVRKPIDNNEVQRVMDKDIPEESDVT